MIDPAAGPTFVISVADPFWIYLAAGCFVIYPDVDPVVIDPAAGAFWMYPGASPRTFAAPGATAAVGACSLRTFTGDHCLCDLDPVAWVPFKPGTFAFGTFGESTVSGLGFAGFLGLFGCAGFFAGATTCVGAAPTASCVGKAATHAGTVSVKAKSNANNFFIFIVASSPIPPGISLVDFSTSFFS